VYALENNFFSKEASRLGSNNYNMLCRKAW